MPIHIDDPREKRQHCESTSMLAELGMTVIDGHAVRTQPVRVDLIGDANPLSDLALIVRALHPSPADTRKGGSRRLGELVCSGLAMSHDEAAAAWAMAGAEPSRFERGAFAFHAELMHAIRSLGLHRLFCGSSAGDHHRGICPAAYDERTGEIHAQEMAQWRADFRALAPERQMVAATIVWLYRSGPDTTWLRRVPCTWLAVEALRYMQDAGCVSLWLRLVCTCPGW